MIHSESILCSFIHNIIYQQLSFFFFFFNDTATTEIYTLSLHDALPIFAVLGGLVKVEENEGLSEARRELVLRPIRTKRSEEHTSELQSRSDLVCRLLLEKKKYKYTRLKDVQHSYKYTDGNMSHRMNQVT